MSQIPRAEALARVRAAVCGFSAAVPLTQDIPAQSHVFSDGARVAKIWAPELSDKAAAQVTRQRDVAQYLSDGAHLAPRMHSYDADHLIAVMDRALGEPADYLWRATAAPSLLHRAGGWTAALHAATCRSVPLRPQGQLNWLDRLVHEAETGARVIPDLPAFRIRAAAMTDLAERVRKRRTIKTVTHRDLHLANLLMGEAVTGIDFENAREDEALRDLYSLALDAMSAHPDADRLDIAGHLAQGYSADLGKPGPRLFFQRAFALGTWANTPEHPSRKQAARFDAALWMLEQNRSVFETR